MKLALLTGTADLAALQSPDRLFLFDTAQLALGNKPPLAADRAQYTALDDLLAKSLQELVLRFIGTQDN